MGSIEPARYGPIGPSVDLIGANLRLTGLTVARNGTLQISIARGSNLLKVVAGGGATFSFGLDGSPSIRAAHRSWSPAADDTGSIVLRSDPVRYAPMILKARVPDYLPDVSDESGPEPPLTLEDVPIKAIRFGRERSGATTEPFVSSIEHGQITFAGTGEILNFSAGAPLVLSGFTGFLLTFNLGSDGLHMAFTGTAQGVLLGPVGFDKDVRPSYFDVLYHVTWLRILLGLLLTVFGPATSLLSNKQAGESHQQERTR